MKGFIGEYARAALVVVAGLILAAFIWGDGFFVMLKEAKANSYDSQGLREDYVALEAVSGLQEAQCPVLEIRDPAPKLRVGRSYDARSFITKAKSASGEDLKAKAGITGDITPEGMVNTAQKGVAVVRYYIEDRYGTYAKKTAYFVID